MFETVLVRPEAGRSPGLMREVMIASVASIYFAATIHSADVLGCTNADILQQSSVSG